MASAENNNVNSMKTRRSMAFQRGVTLTQFAAASTARNRNSSVEVRETSMNSKRLLFPIGLSKLPASEPNTAIRQQRPRLKLPRRLSLLNRVWPG